MTRSGIQYPDTVDLITHAQDGTVRLILAEATALTGNEVLALQQKLKHYLAFATDGRLEASRPELRGEPVRIRVDLYAQPDPLVLTFLRRFRVLALKDGVDLELSIDQHDVVL